MRSLFQVFRNLMEMSDLGAKVVPLEARVFRLAAENSEA